MRQKPGTPASSCNKATKDIRRETGRNWSSEENIRIVLDGAAMEQEIAESKRPLYVSLTRPRDGLIFAANTGEKTGPCMETLAAAE